VARKARRSGPAPKEFYGPVHRDGGVIRCPSAKAAGRGHVDASPQRILDESEHLLMLTRVATFMHETGHEPDLGRQPQPGQRR